MRRAGSPIELDELVGMAEDIATMLHTVPEEFFREPALVDELTGPLQRVARETFGPWVCEITTTNSLGINDDGAVDHIRGDDHASFVGVLKTVDLKAIDVDLELTNGLECLVVPSLVFDTVDHRQFDSTLAQRYIWVAVPLLGSLVVAQKFPMMWSAN